MLIAARCVIGIETRVETRIAGALGLCRVCVCRRRRVRGERERERERERNKIKEGADAGGAARALTRAAADDI